MANACRHSVTESVQLQNVLARHQLQLAHASGCGWQYVVKTENTAED